jgi:hypothetical protein
LVLAIAHPPIIHIRSLVSTVSHSFHLLLKIEPAADRWVCISEEAAPARYISI